MEHKIRITVVAECSQFGSNMNVIPILAEYPTMRVLLQNVPLSVHNVAAVLKNLNDSINTFKQDLATFRKKLTIKRSKMGYELDVRGDHAQTVEESAESNFSASLESPTKLNSSHHRRSSIVSLKGDLQFKSSLKQPNQNHNRHSRNKSITSKSQIKKSDINMTNNSVPNKKSAHHHNTYHHHRHSSSTSTTASTGPTRRSAAKDKKDVWGVGKTGSTLSYILRAGLFALSLSSKEGQPSIVLITDGVVKSNIQDESVIRQLTAENIYCSVVQVGHDKGFFPGLNFGFVPDNEILEFVTSATNGQFMFAENCPPITLNSTEDRESHSLFEPPNIYHHRLLLKEIQLDKGKSSRQSRKSKDGTTGGDSNSQVKTMDLPNDPTAPTVVDLSSSGALTHIDHRIFPWDPSSHPIVEDIGICKYKEYFLPAECWHFMRARLRQGFLLYSVALIDETKASTKAAGIGGPKYIGQTIDEENLSSNFQRKESVIIVFVLHWQPSITVEYRIKSLWTSSLRHYLKTLSMNQERLVNIPDGPHILENDNLFSCMRAPKAQIIIKSTASFTHMLSNWDQFQRRNQMMAVQGAKSSIDLTGAPGFIKVGKMKRLLERLSETDGMLKQLVQFNLSDKIGSHVSSHEVNSDILLKGDPFHPNMSKPPNSSNHSAQSSYIQKFSSHWAKLERSELRVFNMCWYDEQFFNLIIESSTIHNDLKDYCMDGANTLGAVYDQAQLELDIIHHKFEAWSTFISEDQQVYVKILNIDQATFPSDERLSFNAPTSSKRHIIPQFCELRSVRETDKVLCVKLMFFNVDIQNRHRVTDELQTILSSLKQYEQSQIIDSSEIESPQLENLGTEEVPMAPNLVTIPKRPLSSLLMRDTAHFLPTGTEPENSRPLSIAQSPSNANGLNSKSMWYVNPALVLTGEYIVQNYLVQHTWHWDARDIPSDKQSYDRYFEPILNIAFEHIAAARINQV